jgi:serine phosphatase RsbU (regulator of sigma subunit)/anti-sigma regulatory factor (Ser/Thr protein kinase)
VDRPRDRTEERLALLVRAGEMFHRSLEVGETLDNVARMAVESFADLCLFDLIDDQSARLYVTAGAHRNPAVEPMLKNLASAILYNTTTSLHPAVRVSRTGEPYFLPVVDEAAIMEHATSPEHAGFMRRMGYRSKIVVAVEAQGRIFGALTFVRTGNAEPFGVHDVQAAEELGRRAGLAVANAKQYYREQHVAATLQRAFLSQDFPSRPGLVFHALYRPAVGDSDLGGDWYDAFEIGDGTIIITIGDVTGKGIEAARLMVQLRQSVRIAATLSREPSEILRIVNQSLLYDRADALATAFVGVIGPRADAVRYASAGHPSALLRLENGALQTLASTAPPLGVFADTVFEAATVEITGPSLLVLYTDGVTEAARDPVAGEELLRRVVESEAAVHAANPARYIERAVAIDEQRDDVAILTVQFGFNERQWRFEAGDSAVAYAIKRDFMATLNDLAEASAESVEACELIFAELIGNVVRHAPGPLSISLCATGPDVTLHVIDEGPGFDFRPALPDDVWAECGRGLYLISKLSRDVAVSHLPGYGSHITVMLPVVSRELVPALTS